MSVLTRRMDGKLNKRNMPLQQSTAFWKSLGIVVRKRARAVKRYRPAQDFGALRRTGVTQQAIDKVYSLSLRHKDELLFKNFSRFFRKDIETVKVWTNTSTNSDAFIKLFNIFHRNTLENAKKRLLELALIFEFYKKGEGQIFSGKYGSRLAIRNFLTSNLRSKLTSGGGNSDYIQKGVAQFGKERIIWIQKNTDGKKTDKFIKLSRSRNILNVSLSMDSKKEYYVAKHEIEKKFNTFLETPSSKKDLKKIFTFLKIGKSTHFTLSGSTYLDAEFRVTITPSNNRIENIAALGIYKEKIIANPKKLEYLTQLRLSHISKTLSRPIFVSILTYRDGIFGAILLHPDDKRLTTIQRRSLYLDFYKDFGLPLNEFLEHDDLGKETIYRLFLETIPAKTSKVELRSKLALSIYTSLVSDKLIVPNTTAEEVSKVCVNSTCSGYYKPVWDSKKYCSLCKEVLINGRSVEIRTIDEKSIIDFLSNKFTEGNVSNTDKKLLSRKIFISQITYKNETVDFIPISKPLNENQINVLKFRYPHSVIVTTRPDKAELIAKGCQAISLWELVHSIYNSNTKIIKDYTRNARTQSLANMRNLCTISVGRITSTAFYKARNKEVKNLGAELFEADCSILFDYVFGNCLWLGAKHRGVSLPDGFTAFPMLETNKGSFIWDGKFSEGRQLVMGQFAKNKKYIEEAKVNKSIKDNGGLKGFVFISNNKFPASFLKKYLPLTKGRKLKISFIRAEQFQKITEHYRKNERLILNNSKARNHFSDAMISLFFSTVKDRKTEIITDARIDSIIRHNDTYFGTLSAGKTLRP